MIKQLLSLLILIFKYAPISATIKTLERIINASIIPLLLISTQKLIDNLYKIKDGYYDFNGLIVWVLIIMLLTFISYSSSLISSLQSINMKRELNKKFMNSIVSKFLKIDYSCFEDKNVKDTLYRMGNSPQDKLIEIFDKVIDVIAQMLTIVELGIIFAQISFSFSIVFFIIVISMTYITYKAMILVNNLYNKQTEDERKMEYFNELLVNKDSLYELKIFNAKDYILKKLINKTDIVLNERLLCTMKSQKYFALSNVCILLWIGTLLFNLINLVSKGNISLGLFVSIVGSATSIVSVSDGLSLNSAILSEKYLQMEHYSNFIKLPEDKTKKNNFPNFDKIKIEFKNVYFKYPSSNEYVLKNINFSINEGEKIALVGKNGAGKSTIIKLLCRLYKPTSGQILVNDCDIFEIDDLQYSKIISVLFQDFMKYSLTLRENIAFGNIEKLNDDNKIKDALNNVSLTSLLMNLDINLGKIEDDGIELSGGEWQRIALARALISDSSLIILDEPTAALDPVAESEMYLTFHNLMKDKTYIMVSHRLASARIANKILVIDNGEIVESGTHEELLCNKYKYMKMWNAQSQWYS
ncbi:ABC transporter ATP-binding protein (plasmid) [Clostridium perfringens]|uniref:ABC transporter ATP-binding protein n=1 Tax=Clostridium perfringens TaxID=1502 RepID=UPI0030D0C5C5